MPYCLTLDYQDFEKSHNPQPGRIQHRIRTDLCQPVRQFRYMFPHHGIEPLPWLPGMTRRVLHRHRPVGLVAPPHPLVHEHPMPLEVEPHPVDGPEVPGHPRVHAQKKLGLLLLARGALADDERAVLPVRKLPGGAFQLAAHLGDPIEDGRVKLMHLLEGEGLVGEHQAVHSSHLAGFTSPDCGELMVKV